MDNMDNTTTHAAHSSANRTCILNKEVEFSTASSVLQHYVKRFSHITTYQVSDTKNPQDVSERGSRQLLDIYATTEKSGWITFQAVYHDQCRAFRSTMQVLIVTCKIVEDAIPNFIVDSLKMTPTGDDSFIYELRTFCAHWEEALEVIAKQSEKHQIHGKKVVARSDSLRRMVDNIKAYTLPMMACANALLLTLEQAEKVERLYDLPSKLLFTCGEIPVADPDDVREPLMITRHFHIDVGRQGES